MSSRAAIGGGYGALVKKSKNAGPKKDASNTNNQPKTKTAKVMSLKDTNEKHPAPHKAAKEEKKQEQPKKTVEKEEKRDLTRREVKSERAASDRHVPRSGRADHSKTPKNEQVAEALDAEKTDEKTDKEYEKRRQEEAEAAAERKRKEEEEQRQMTFADYEKALQEKKKELGFKVHERKVDAKGYAKLTEMGAKKDDNAEFFKLAKKVEETKPAKPAAKKSGKDAKVAAAAKPATKKGKFVKSADVQLGFFSKPEKPVRTGGYKGGKGNRENNRGDAAPAPAPEAKPEETTEAAAPATEEAAPEASQ